MGNDLDGELAAELAALRRRAYGVGADIQDDPAAVARLHELEELKRLNDMAPPPLPLTPIEELFAQAGAADEPVSPFAPQPNRRPAVQAQPAPNGQPAAQPVVPPTPHPNPQPAPTPATRPAPAVSPHPPARTPDRPRRGSRRHRPGDSGDHRPGDAGDGRHRRDRRAAHRGAAPRRRSDRAERGVRLRPYHHAQLR